MSPNLMLMISPGTKITASCSLHLPSRSTWQQTKSQQHDYHGESKDMKRGLRTSYSSTAWKQLISHSKRIDPHGWGTILVTLEKGHRPMVESLIFPDTPCSYLTSSVHNTLANIFFWCSSNEKARKEGQTLVFGARWAMRAAAAFPALFSSMKLMVEFTSSKTRIPRKSSQSGGRPYRQNSK